MKQKEQWTETVAKFMDVDELEGCPWEAIFAEMAQRVMALEQWKKDLEEKAR